jgi:hypothetical protein
MWRISGVACDVEYDRLTQHADKNILILTAKFFILTQIIYRFNQQGG